MHAQETAVTSAQVTPRADPQSASVFTLARPHAGHYDSAQWQLTGYQVRYTLAAQSAALSESRAVFSAVTSATQSSLLSLQPPVCRCGLPSPAAGCRCCGSCQSGPACTNPVLARSVCPILGTHTPQSSQHSALCLPALMLLLSLHLSELAPAGAQG